MPQLLRLVKENADFLDFRLGRPIKHHERTCLAVRDQLSAFGLRLYELDLVLLGFKPLHPSGRSVLQQMNFHALRLGQVANDRAQKKQQAEDKNDRPQECGRSDALVAKHFAKLF